MPTTTIVSRVIADCKGYRHATRWQRPVELSSAALTGQTHPSSSWTGPASRQT
jgi:hypothetical protein